jgi:hypothetical protein
MNNVVNKNIETLGSDNFQHWAFGMEKWLDAIGVWELTFDRPRPLHPGDLPELLVFERNEAIGQDDDENEAIAEGNRREQHRVNQENDTMMQQYHSRVDTWHEWRMADKKALNVIALHVDRDNAAL